MVVFKSEVHRSIRNTTEDVYRVKGKAHSWKQYEILIFVKLYLYKNSSHFFLYPAFVQCPQMFWEHTAHQDKIISGWSNCVMFGIVSNSGTESLLYVDKTLARFLG